MNEKPRKTNASVRERRSHDVSCTPSEIADRAKSIAASSARNRYTPAQETTAENLTVISETVYDDERSRCRSASFHTPKSTVSDPDGHSEYSRTGMQARFTKETHSNSSNSNAAKPTNALSETSVEISKPDVIPHVQPSEPDQVERQPSSSTRLETPKREHRRTARVMPKVMPPYDELISLMLT